MLDVDGVHGGRHPGPGAVYVDVLGGRVGVVRGQVHDR
ncbi:hypothetical protein ES703_52641 [subsurface metagenome]